MDSKPPAWGQFRLPGNTLSRILMFAVLLGILVATRKECSGGIAGFVAGFGEKEPTEGAYGGVPLSPTMTEEERKLAIEEELKKARAAAEIAPLRIRQIADGLYVHETKRTFGGEEIISNGIVVVGDEKVLVVDTPWGMHPTRELLAWTKKEWPNATIQALGTHFHGDRIGGLAVLKEHGIDLQVTAKTKEMFGKAAESGLVAQLESEQVIPVGGRTATVFFPGPGHTEDNIVVYLSDGVLFAGCFLKGSESKTLGNVKDANVAQWGKSIERLKERFPDAQRIVVSHSVEIGKTAMEHTLELLNNSNEGP